MSVLTDAFFVRRSIRRAQEPQDSGKGPVIGNIFTSPRPGSVYGETNHVNSDIMHVDDNMNSEGKSAGPMTADYSDLDPGEGVDIKQLENIPANFMMDFFNDTSNSSFGLFDGFNNYSFLLDCDNSTDPNTLCVFNNDSNPTTLKPPELPEHTYWSLFLLIFPFLTVFGNVLVVLSIYRERSLRHVTNYFICSLAIADILVAVIVMPPAVFMEVTKYWSLSDELCDAWVAFDVMACTASILNLTAISVDRFIAVTQPIKYAKHKNSKRVHVMLALTWVVSIAIAAPIALGVNYSHARTPGSCSFFNSDFLIYSSMGSFYIPSLIMIFLYWRIYRVLRIRAQKSIATKKARSIDTQTLTNVIENTAANTVEPTDKTGLANMDNGKISTYNTTTSNNCKTNNHKDSQVDEASTSNPPTNTDSNEKEEDEESDSKSPVHLSPHSDLIVNPVAEDLEKREQLAARNKQHVTVKETSEMETHFSLKEDNQDDNSSCKQTSSDSKERRKKEKKNVTKFNFHMRTSRKRKERSSSRRERKATKTLAIVLVVIILGVVVVLLIVNIMCVVFFFTSIFTALLAYLILTSNVPFANVISFVDLRDEEDIFRYHGGVFLLCWWPFFTVNIMRAICLRYEVLNYPTCDIDGNLMGFFVWLGYINSFLNPVIYTIFNPEFRKAFKKILTQPCPSRY